MQSKYGVGSLFKWNSEEVVSIQKDDYGWLVRTKLEDGTEEEFSCFEVMKFEAQDNINSVELEG